MVKHKPKSVLILWLRPESRRLLGDDVLRQSSSINKTFNQCSIKNKIISIFAKVLVNWKIICFEDGDRKNKIFLQVMLL